MLQKLGPPIPNRRKNIFQSVFTTGLLCVIASAMVAICAVTYFTYCFMLGEKGKSRVDVLQQISDSNTVNRTTMVRVMDMLYEDFYELLTCQDTTGEQICGQLEETGALLRHIGMDYTIDIVMNDRRAFSTNRDSRSIDSLTRTYWYIRHYSGETDTSWNLRFLDAKDISSFGLSYGRTIFDKTGRSLGVIVLTTAHEALFRTFQKLVNDGATVYILDQNGIIVSHSNAQRVGNWGANMQAFIEENPPNTYRVLQRRGQSILLSTYRDPDSGWTFVEEQEMDALLLEGMRMLRSCMLAVLLGALLAGLLGYLRARRVTRAIEDFSGRIGSIPAGRIALLPVQEEYEELFVLSTAFNDMIRRIQSLIREIRLHEQEKQRNEYDFLQAQINPHFLNNTLIAVRSLLGMGEMERASRMMGELIELLHVPPTPEVQFVPLAEELHLVRNYISIMNCRTEKEVEFCSAVPQEFLPLLVPRMILQPLVGNSFFHGFAEKDEGCRICIRAGMRGKSLYLTVEDNGEGILPKRLEEVRSGHYRSSPAHHGIGLKNVDRRVKIIYGGQSRVEICSEPGKSAVVTILIDRYQERMQEGAGEDEDSDCR